MSLNLSKSYSRKDNLIQEIKDFSEYAVKSTIPTKHKNAFMDQNFDDDIKKLEEEIAQTKIRT